MADLSPDDLDVLMRGLRELREINKAHLGRLRKQFPAFDEATLRALVDDALLVLKDESDDEKATGEAEDESDDETVMYSRAAGAAESEIADDDMGEEVLIIHSSTGEGKEDHAKELRQLRMSNPAVKLAAEFSSRDNITKVDFFRNTCEAWLLS